MNFFVYGPFEVPRQNRYLVTRSSEDKNDFWDSVEEDADGLPEAIGCYVFYIRAIPWYIGLAERQPFRTECFSPHKITRYDSALSKGAGNPQLILIAKLTPQARFARPSTNGHRDIRMLESLIVGMAVARNQSIENLKGTKLLRRMNVPGVLNTTRGQGRALAVQNLRRVLGV